MNYLYVGEDMSVLSAFEVYLFTRNMEDFLESVIRIDKLHFFKKGLDYDEIE